MKSTSMETTTVAVRESMPSLLEKCGKIAVLLSETRFNGRGLEVVRSLDYAVAIDDHNVRSRPANYQKLVREQVLALHGVDNSRSSNQYFYRLY